MNGNTHQASPPRYDCLVIGGGPGGLTAALTLARQLHTVAVFDSGEYHNAGTPYMHTVPTWDHKPPEEFRRAARENTLANYETVTYFDVSVASVAANAAGSAKTRDAFVLKTADGKEYAGAKLVLASGVKDVYPDIPGFADAWPTGIFHCLFCHGYEERGAGTSGVLSVGPMGGTAAGALHFARNALQLTEKVVVYTDGNKDVAAEVEGKLGEAKDRLSVDARKIVRLEKGSRRAEVILHFEDGTTFTPKFLMHMPASVPRGPFVEMLGLEMSMGNVAVKSIFNETSVKGVFAVGDLITHQKIFNLAVSSGCSAGAGVAVQLQADHWGHVPLGGH